MNAITITIPKSDLSYVIEAVRLRGLALADQIASQAFEIERAHDIKKQEQEESWNVSTINDQMIAVLQENDKNKKSAKAPYGYKLDGTPKKRPGRHPKRSRK